MIFRMKDQKPQSRKLSKLVFLWRRDFLFTIIQTNIVTNKQENKRKNAYKNI